MIIDGTEYQEIAATEYDSKPAKVVSGAPTASGCAVVLQVNGSWSFVKSGNGQVLEKLPFDLGREAFMSQINLDQNPFKESDWQHNEWYLGWSDEEECDGGESYDWSNDSFREDNGE